MVKDTTGRMLLIEQPIEGNPFGGCLVNEKPYKVWMPAYKTHGSFDVAISPCHAMQLCNGMDLSRTQVAHLYRVPS